MRKARRQSGTTPSLTFFGNRKKMLLRTLPRAASAWRGALGAERTNAPLLVRPITTIRPEKKYPVVVLGGGTAAGYAAAELAARRAFGGSLQRKMLPLSWRNPGCEWKATQR